MIVQDGGQIAEGDQAAWGGIMICAATDEQAWAQAEDMLWMWDAWSVSFGNGRPPLLIGSPDTITRQIEEAASTFPLKDNFLIYPQGIAPREEVLRSLELFGTKVMPRFS